MCAAVAVKEVEQLLECRRNRVIDELAKGERVWGHNNEFGLRLHALVV